MVSPSFELAAPGEEFYGILRALILFLPSPLESFSLPLSFLPLCQDEGAGRDDKKGRGNADLVTLPLLFPSFRRHPATATREWWASEHPLWRSAFSLASSPSSFLPSRWKSSLPLSLATTPRGRRSAGIRDARTSQGSDLPLDFPFSLSSQGTFFFSSPFPFRTSNRKDKRRR